MRRSMRMAIHAITVLGLVLLALATTGISGMSSELEAAAPPRSAPATEEFTYESRQIDCPLKEREPRRL